MELPQLPAPVDRYLHQTEKCNTQAELHEATTPYIQYESKLREIFAQYPDHSAAKQDHLVPLFSNNNPTPVIRARNPDSEPEKVRDQYLLPLTPEERKKDGDQAIVKNVNEFQTNFNLFSESSLVDLDWSNVVAAGSAVVTAILPVPAPHNESKRNLRTYYHQILAPASDVDLFLYGLNEEEAVEKIKTIERAIRDSILSETTTIRTKNTITIVSEYPTRHVQIVLRLYKSVSEILTGFDVDCACVAYDGKQVWASPRSLAAYMTQLNTVDLTRRSPSYENRLSKYSHRGFEVHWSGLDRARIDPTIYERTFSRVLGLARLLVLEKLPHPTDREVYLAKRREERGRPPRPSTSFYQYALVGNVKDDQPDDVAEWVEEDDVSNYHTFTIPYGPKYNAKRIEKLLFTKDLLLNAEWNRQKDRETNLHRHPAFFGFVEDVIHDCCDFCPKPETDEDLAALEEESKIYISGDLKFVKDDPGRQTIGSFHPLTDDDWTEQAYVGNTAVLCQAIVDKDLEAVTDWFSHGELETIDVNQRDHAGRTPLLLATMCSTPEIVQYLIDHDARIVSRLYNGLTALHIAAFRGEPGVVKALLDRSEANEAEQDRKEESRKIARRAAAETNDMAIDAEPVSDSGSDDDGDEVDEDDKDADESSDEVTDGSFVKVAEKSEDIEEETDGPDVYDVDVVAWDSPLSALHLAIIAGKVDVVELLINTYGADVLLPVRVMSSYNRAPQGAILSLTLALQPPLNDAREMMKSMVSLGALPTQGDMRGISALHYVVNHGKESLLRVLTANTDPATLKKAINHVAVSGRGWSCRAPDVPLVTAIRNRQPDVVAYLLNNEALPEVDFEAFSRSWELAEGYHAADADARKDYNKTMSQPLIVAVEMEMPRIAMDLIEAGADVNVCPTIAYDFLDGNTYRSGNKSLLNLVDEKIRDLTKYIDEQQHGPEKPQAPAALEADDVYLDYPKHTYRYWAAIKNLEQAKEVKAQQQEDYQQELRRMESLSPKCGEEKLAAVKDVLQEMEDLKALLIAEGAKGFRQLFPDAPKPDHREFWYHPLQKIANEPYQTAFKFKDSALTDARKELYLQLFEAAWVGDIGSVKSLTLSSEKPLPVAVQDSAGFSPFSIAVFRGHHDLARVILEISTVQYKPNDDEPKYRYYLGGHNGSSDYDSEVSMTQGDDDPHIFAEIVDEKFTVDNIVVLADSVKSRVSPLTMVEWEAEWWRCGHVGDPKAAKLDSSFYKKSCFLPGRAVEDKSSWAWFNAILSEESSRCRSTLARHAIVKNDLNLLKFLIQTGTELVSRREDDEETLRAYALPSREFDFAIGLGRIEMVGEIIATTGAGIPLQAMVKTNAIELDEKPKYYQGLSVRGKKRQDWAARGRGNRRPDNTVETSLVLRSILERNLRSAEYFHSDAPLNRYLEFAKRFEADKRIQGLAQAKGGMEGALSTWLSTRSELAMHVAIMAAPMKDGSSPMFDYILRTRPETIEVKSKRGNTPLHTALKLRRISAAKALLKAGANQVARNDSGENVLHIMFADSHYSEAGPEVFRAALELFEPKLVSEMLMERSNAVEPSLNPLAVLVKDVKTSSLVVEACKIVIDFSKGRDLEVLNGAGDYLLHTLVRNHFEHLVKHLVDYRPEMLRWENATGMTPIDVAETAYLRDVAEITPSLEEARIATIIEESEEKFQTNRTKTGEELVKDELDAFISAAGDEDLNGRSESWRMYRLLQELARKHAGKRKLVSVLEANEVAKRLATQQQMRHREERRLERLSRMDYAGSYSGPVEWANYDDEVGRWNPDADLAKKWDWERWTAELTGKEVASEESESEMPRTGS